MAAKPKRIFKTSKPVEEIVNDKIAELIAALERMKRPDELTEIAKKIWRK